MRIFDSSIALVSLLLSLCLSVMGCSGSDSSTTGEDPYAAALSTGGASSSSSSAGSNSETDPEPDDGMMVEGILGHISEASINRGMDRGMDAIFGCFQRRYGAIEFLGGDLELYFRVKTDGRVRFVYLRNSTLGDRATERCIESAAARFRFTAPDGGEAEFAAPLSLDPPEDIRPPVAWRESRVAALVRSEGAAILGECSIPRESHDSLKITAYVARGGSVMAVGAAVDDPESGAALDCVTARVMRWSMPDPGSYPAKITFGLR